MSGVNRVSGLARGGDDGGGSDWRALVVRGEGEGAAIDAGGGGSG